MTSNVAKTRLQLMVNAFVIREVSCCQIKHALSVLQTTLKLIIKCVFHALKTVFLVKMMIHVLNVLVDSVGMKLLNHA